MTVIHSLSCKVNKNEFYVKREDLLPFSFGGNKARKAMLFLEDIRKNNCDTVVTYGSSSSNHCRIIANMAASENFKCVIISPEEDYKETSNSRLVRLCGAEIVKTPLATVADTIDDVMRNLRTAYKPYFIQGGGHGNIGTEAYVQAYNEICEYEKKNDMFFDYIFHASGTGTTQAGLVSGRLLKNHTNRRIIGISIARNIEKGKKVILDSICDYFGKDTDYSKEVEFIDDYICGGYGKYNQEVVNIIKDVFISDGMVLNETYTAKAFWGMKEYVIKHGIYNKNILFINTGGTPLFFDKLEDLEK